MFTDRLPTDHSATDIPIDIEEDQEIAEFIDTSMTFCPESSREEYREESDCSDMGDTIMTFSSKESTRSNSTEPLVSKQPAPLQLITPPTTPEEDKIIPIQPLVEQIACRLYTVGFYNHRFIPMDQHKTTKFNAKNFPIINIQKYLERFIKYAELIADDLILFMALLDRFILKTKMILNFYNVHRLSATTLMIVNKCYEDNHFDNASFAFFAGVSNAEMNSLEEAFLIAMDYDLIIKGDNYLDSLQELTRSAFTTDELTKYTKEYEQMVVENRSTYIPGPMCFFVKPIIPVYQYFHDIIHYLPR